MMMMTNTNIDWHSEMLGGMTYNHFAQSNRIEKVTDPSQIQKSAQAWQYLMSLSVIKERDIRHVHEIVMTGLMWPQDIGVWRSINVEVAGRGCPHFASVPGDMERYVKEINRELDRYRYDQNNLSLVALLYHVKFEHIHPFRDGNGRVGRLLWWWHEVQLGLTPTLVTYESRFKYYGVFD
jgi:Fic family protein